MQHTLNVHHIERHTYNTLQQKHCTTHTTTHTLQHTHCNTHTATCSTGYMCQDAYPTCNALKHTAPHCTTLHHTAPHYNTLQHSATHCNTLHHSNNSKLSQLTFVFPGTSTTGVCAAAERKSEHVRVAAPPGEKVRMVWKSAMTVSCSTWPY